MENKIFVGLVALFFVGLLVIHAWFKNLENEEHRKPPNFQLCLPGNDCANT